MNFSARYQPLFIIAAALAGIGLGRVPGIDEIAVHLVEPALTALLYFVFLSADGGQLRAAFRNVRFTMTAAAANFVWTPLFAYALGMLFFRESIDMRIGLMMLLVTPCTDWYLVFTALARGNVILGASILPLNLTLQILLLPLYLGLFYGDAMPAAGSSLILGIVLLLALPLGLAFLTKTAEHDRLGARCVRQLRAHGDTAQLILLLIAVGAMFAAESAAFFAHPMLFADMLFVMLIFFAVNYILVRRLGRRLGFAGADLTALSFTTLARNSPLALAIAAAAFPDRPLIALALIIGPLIELPALTVVAHRILREHR
ncbi:bile acid:sodium symporter [Selenomonas sp. TAMA-11512]|uniref:arsenic resistance protein n=1 Tax=Selenomonas sp. TAMA-11512 TaxID=3095337 RepID=UPI0030859FDE|nr:bile acid:sodium symporter [Selenomonas sp. TAMA-11512]